jgi:hypothetical protein
MDLWDETSQIQIFHRQQPVARKTYVRSHCAWSAGPESIKVHTAKVDLKYLVCLVSWHRQVPFQAKESTIIALERTE